MTDNEIIIFTDGGAIGNPGSGGFGAIIYNKTAGTVLEIGGNEKNTTNNRMELKAIIEALKNVEDGFITIYSDSKYSITGITQWIFGWRQNDWQTKNKTSVLNKDLWQELSTLVENKEIEWKHVAGHVGIPGNERVDVIANSFARGNSPELFSGKIKDYKINLTDVKKVDTLSADKKSNKKAYSYISMVDGKIESHKTWVECEARVKGKKAKFKKTFSKEEEEELIKNWLNES